MAKKRTTTAFYGKREQRLDQMATRAFGAGDRELGETIVKVVHQSVKEKRAAGPRYRKTAPWVPNIKGTRFEQGVRVAR